MFRTRSCTIVWYKVELGALKTPKARNTNAPSAILYHTTVHDRVLKHDLSLRLRLVRFEPGTLRTEGTAHTTRP